MRRHISMLNVLAKGFATETTALAHVFQDLRERLVNEAFAPTNVRDMALVKP
jgi:hypothetical protein